MQTLEEMRRHYTPMEHTQMAKNAGGTSKRLITKKRLITNRRWLWEMFLGQMEEFHGIEDGA